MATGTYHAWLRPYRDAASHAHPVLRKYAADRGPHLAAMVAYYALLSLFPFLFLSLSALGLMGRMSERSYVIREMQYVLPHESTHDLIDLVASVQRNAGTLFAIGLFGMVWSSLGFYSALESALNIVFRVPNRGFLRQKWVTFLLVMSSLGVLFVSLALAGASTGWVERHSPHLFTLHPFPYVATLVMSSLGSFLFLMAVYRVLTNVELHRGDVWPGALFGTVLFQVSFQALPLYLRFGNALVALRAFGGLVILLVWLYLMANIIVLGAEINWAHWSRHEREPELTGLA